MSNKFIVGEGSAAKGWRTNTNNGGIMSINISGMTSNQLQTLTTNIIDLMQKKDGVTKVI